MKELTIEEKARAYDGVREKIAIRFGSNVADEIFSEYEESEDERIRKDIISFVEQAIDAGYGIISKERKEKWIAWLEKQGEHAKFRDSIQVGDKVTRNRDGVLVNLSQLERVAKKDEKQCEQKSADKVEPKFHEGDMIIHKELGGDYIHNPHKIIQVDMLDKKYRLEGGLVAHFCEQDDYELVEQKPADTEKGAKGNDREIPNSAWSEEDENRVNRLIAYFEDKESFTAEDDIVYANWLKSLKGIVQPQKQEWSEKDKCMLNNVIDTLKPLSQTTHSGYAINSMIDWLKSLKDRYTWKPSEEQMEALKGVQEGVFRLGILDSLYQDLKKLK